MKLKMLLLLATLPLALSACGRSEDSGTSVSPSSDAGTARHEKEGEANHEDEGGHIELTAEQIEAAGIQLHQVGPAVIREALPLLSLIHI